MWNGLTVVAFQLTDINPGDGGLCLVPGKPSHPHSPHLCGRFRSSLRVVVVGSHKSKFARPKSMSLLEEHAEFVQEVPCSAGDCIIFSGALASLDVS